MALGASANHLVSSLGGMFFVEGEMESCRDCSGLGCSVCAPLFLPLPPLLLPWRLVGASCEEAPVLGRSLRAPAKLLALPEHCPDIVREVKFASTFCVANLIDKISRRRNLRAVVDNQISRRCK